MSFDTIIIGAGIAGLNTAFKLSQSGHKILLADRSNYLGGRIYTYNGKYNKEKFQYEAGAGRFACMHKLLIQLLEEFGLKDNMIKITNERIPIVRNLTLETRKNLREVYKPNSNEKLDIEFLIKRVLEKADLFSEQFLRTITIYNLAQHILSGPAAQFLLDAFGYDAELLHLNAFDGVRMFKNSFSFDNQYYILKGGLSVLCNKLGEKISENGGIIKLNKEFIDYKLHNGIFEVTLKSLIGEEKYRAKNLVLAIPKVSLMKLEKLYPIRKELNSVIGHDLNRVYAIYPKNSDGKVWFHNIPKITTDNPLQFVIPYNVEQGLIMITYSDDRFANYWRQSIMRKTLEKDLERHLKKIFPNKKIPKPKYLKCHFWKDGAHFYRPGYKSEKIYEKLTKPFEKQNLYIVGECYSLKQAWIEGALESSEKVLKLINKQIGGTNIQDMLKNLPSYTLEEVQKHNKRDDAWMIVDDFVLDVTDWIDSHPGGPNAVMKGIGKDATEIWYSIGSHNMDIALRYFPKFLIGKYIK